jgi:ribosomal protein L40E
MPITARVDVSTYWGWAPGFYLYIMNETNYHKYENKSGFTYELKRFGNDIDTLFTVTSNGTYYFLIENPHESDVHCEVDIKLKYEVIENRKFTEYFPEFYISVVMIIGSLLTLSLGLTLTFVWVRFPNGANERSSLELGIAVFSLILFSWIIMMFSYLPIVHPGTIALGVLAGTPVVAGIYGFIFWDEWDEKEKKFRFRLSSAVSFGISFILMALFSILRLLFFTREWLIAWTGWALDLLMFFFLPAMVAGWTRVLIAKPYAERRIPLVKCPKCGAEMPKKARFCGKCGTKLK